MPTKRQLNVFDQHQKNIAIKTLKMNDVMARIMGGMSKDEAREFLKSIGYTDAQVRKLEASQTSRRAFVASELLKLAKELIGGQFDHPKMEEALDVMRDATPTLLNWLNSNTRLSNWKAAYKDRGANLSSSVYAGLAAVQRFSAAEERIRGGGFFIVDVYANVDGEVVVTSSQPEHNQRQNEDGTYKWADLNDPKKIFKWSRLPFAEKGTSRRRSW